MYADQLLPHDIEAEEALVGALLIDGGMFLTVSSIVKPEDFYRERNRLIYSSCHALYQQGIAIDQVTIAREMARTNQIDAVGGMAYLSHLVSITPTSAHAEHYARLIGRLATMRRLIDAGGRIAALGYADTDDVDATLKQAEETIFKVRGERGDSGFIPLRQIYDEFLVERADAHSTASQMGMLSTGFAALDQVLGGLQRSDLLVLGARPGLGKSTLAMDTCINAAKGGATAGFFSLEMSRQQLGMRLLASESGVDSHRLRLGLYSDPEEQRIIDAIGVLSDLPVYIDDTPFQGMAEMRSKAHRLHLERGMNLLVVDYIQLVQGSSGRSGGNRVMEISEISRSIKGLARDLNIPIIACSQLSRLVENRPGHRPLLSDLRDSGSIEQDSDVVMFIYREDVYYTEEAWAAQFPDRPYPKNQAEIIVAKHRHGPTGSARLLFRDRLVRFEPMLDQRMDDYYQSAYDGEQGEFDNR